ncbi:Uncharacterised protein at_DN0466 [Pycnogonum litorale]
MFGIGKKQAFQTLCRSDLHQTSVSQLGKDTTLSEDTISACEAFVCNLYTKNEKAGSKANDVRYWLFCQKGQKNEGLPPTSDSLRQHIKRANFQSIVWRKALDARQNLPKPEDYGWSISDGVLQAVLMTREPAPRELTELTTCRCKKSSCRLMGCSCRTQNLACTEACACMANEDCQNSDISAW